jgi:hypothetical protein
MTVSHLIDSAVAVLVLSVVIGSLAGYGSLLLRLIGLTDVPRPLHSTLWAGLAMLLVILQALQLLTPLRGAAVLAVLLIGLLLALVFRRQICLPQLPTRPALRTAAVLLATGTVYWLISRAMVTPSLGDSGGYHFQSIAWTNEYAVVPGLGNLGVRLAFVQSYFFLTAFLNFAPWLNVGHALAGPLFTLLTLLAITERAGAALRHHEPAERIFGQLLLALIPIVVALISDLGFFAGPSPDPPSSLITIVLTVLLTQLVLRVRRSAPVDPVDTALIISLAATAITMKLSSLFFAALTVLLIIPLLWAQRRSLQSVFLRAVAFGLLAGMLMISHSLLRSGYPFFPSTFAGIDAVWTMQPQDADRIRLAIYYHARYYRAYLNDESVISRPWLGYWAEQVRRDFPETFAALGVTALLLPIVLAQLLRRRSRDAWFTVFPLLIVLVGLLAWWLSAPAPRFALGLLLIAPLTCVWLILTLASATLPRTIGMALLLIALMPTSVILVRQSDDLLRTSRSGFQPIPIAEPNYFTTSDGLSVNVPSDRGRCWAAALPCTPRLHRKLQRIDGSSLQGGFTTRLPTVQP